MVEAKWSGEYPCLCQGEWTLIVDGKDVSDLIPDDLRYSSMDTYGLYSAWNFGEDWEVYTRMYEDGLDCEDWIDSNNYWLNEITNNEYIKEEIYDAINGEDFRLGSCGGCI